MECVFCKLINEFNFPNDDIIFEDKKVLVILDVDWAVKGHTLVIWKEHVENVSELSLNDYLYFSEIFHKTEKALSDILKVDKSIVLKSGILVSHFHFHIYPVKKDVKWDFIKDMFNKKTHYEASVNERDNLVKKLREKFYGKKITKS